MFECVQDVDGFRGGGTHRPTLKYLYIASDAERPPSRGATISDTQIVERPISRKGVADISPIVEQAAPIGRASKIICAN